MASIRYYPNGAGGTTGADLATLKPGYHSGNRWYLGPGGTDAAGTAGQERTHPLATLAQAVTNASAGDTIVVLSNHLETLAVSQAIAKTRLRLVGEGTGSSVPRFICSGAVNLFDVTAAGVYLDNLYFPASTAAATARVRVTAAGVQLRNLKFDCGASDTNRALSFATGAGQVMMKSCSFKATADAPAVAIEVLNAMSDLVIDDLILDAGSFRWTDYAFKGTAAVTGLVATRLDLLNGSHVLLPTTTTGELYTDTISGDSRVDWTP